MSSENRWIYVVGVAILAGLVVVGVVLRGSDDQDEADAGDAAAASADGAVASDDGGPVGAYTNGDGGEAVDDVGSVPEDPEECRAYCRDLEERGALAEGTDAAGCISSLCALPDEAGDDAEETAPEQQSDAVPSMTEEDLPDLPDDCRAQCQSFADRGELREGTTIEDCYAALCPSDE